MNANATGKFQHPKRCRQTNQKRSRKLPQPSLDQERGRGRQAKPVHVYLPLCVLGDGRCSFDQNLDLLIRRKRLLFEEAFMPPEATRHEAEELFTSTVT